MQSKSKKKVARNASQERWMLRVRSIGCLECQGPAEFHHCVGETAKHNKVAIGHEFGIPLCTHHHRTSMGSVHRMGRNRKEYEKAGFETVLLLTKDCPDRPSEEVIEAIRDYHL